MNQKQNKLAHVKTVWELYEQAQNEADQLRHRLTLVSKEAREARATQQEIANQTGLSRQRIQQLLNEEA